MREESKGFLQLDAAALGYIADDDNVKMNKAFAAIAKKTLKQRLSNRLGIKQKEIF